MCGYFCIGFIDFMEKIFKEEDSIEILRILGFINNIEFYLKNI